MAEVDSQDDEDLLLEDELCIFADDMEIGCSYATTHEAVVLMRKAADEIATLRAALTNGGGNGSG